MGFFRYGELPLVLLALLARRAMNGYEVIGELEEAFGARYIPSPGSVYPALAALRREGLILGAEDGGARRYSLTAAGKRTLAERRDRLSQIELRTGTYLRDDDEVQAEVARLEAAVRAARSRVDPAILGRVLRRARTSLQQLVEEEEG